MSSFRTLDDLDLAGRRVLLRVDFNVPMKDGKVTDATRIERAAVTIRELMGKGARVVILAHFGRPKGKHVPEMSLKPVLPAVEAVLGRPVAFAEDCVGAPAEEAVARLSDGEVLLLENLRFHAGEEKDDAAFADQLARLGDLYVNDAFSAAHRAHASVSGIARRLPSAAGRLMQEELEHLTRALEQPERPLAALVGGAKVSTKLDLLGNLVAKVDRLVIGGGMANTFLQARGIDVAASLCEAEMADTVRAIEERAKAAGCDILLPHDVVVAETFEAGAPSKTVAAEAVPAGHMILDIGPESAEALVKALEACKTLVWNGPLGAFEIPPFDAATNRVAQAAAELTKAGRLLSVAGGGDTVAALAHAGAIDGFSYVSAAGGAFLEWLEGRELPGVAALRQT